MTVQDRTAEESVEILTAEQKVERASQYLAATAACLDICREQKILLRTNDENLGDALLKVVAKLERSMIDATDLEEPLVKAVDRVVLSRLAEGGEYTVVPSSLTFKHKANKHRGWLFSWTNRKTKGWVTRSLGPYRERVILKRTFLNSIAGGLGKLVVFAFKGALVIFFAWLAKCIGLIPVVLK